MALLLIGCCCPSSQAATDCALATLDLINRNQISTLAARFEGGETPALRNELQVMVQAAGRLTELKPQSGPAFSKSVRLSANASEVSNRSVYLSAWIGAQSSTRGGVQWQLALKPDGDCVLLALHLEWPLADAAARPTATGARRL